MRRLIQFRAIREDDGKWVYGDLTHDVRITDNGKRPQIRVDGYNVDENTIGEYTGLEGKQGTPIYEDDIVEYIDERTCKAYRFKVVFSKGLFGLENEIISRSVTSLSSHIMTEYVVIGNIHENAGLLNI